MQRDIVQGPNAFSLIIMGVPVQRGFEEWWSWFPASTSDATQDTAISVLKIEFILIEDNVYGEDCIMRVMVLSSSNLYGWYPPQQKAGVSECTAPRHREFRGEGF